MAHQDVLHRALCALLECLVQVASGCVHFYFFESVADICPVIMGFTFGKCVWQGLTSVSGHLMKVQLF